MVPVRGGGGGAPTTSAPPPRRGTQLSAYKERALRAAGPQFAPPRRRQAWVAKLCLFHEGGDLVTDRAFGRALLPRFQSVFFEAPSLAFFGAATA